MEILIYIIPFVVCSPLLIIGIIKFANLFSYKKINLDYIEATLTKTDYDSSGSQSLSNYTYSYSKIGTYTFDLDGKTYEFTYSADREHGHLPKKITACYPKGKPQKAFEENHAPIVKEFFNSVKFLFIYGILSLIIFIILLYVFG